MFATFPLVRKISVLITMLLSLGSCKHETHEFSVPPKHSSNAVSPPDASKFYKGLFVVGKGQLSFQECRNPDEKFLIVDSTGKMTEQYHETFLHSPAFPNEYVYAELQGTMRAATGEQKKQFDSVLTVSEIVTVAPTTYENSCIPYDFWAVGKDWSLQISEKEHIIVFKDYALMSVAVFQYFSPKSESDDNYTYASNNYAAGIAIRATFKKNECSEEGSKSIFHYSSRIIISGKIYSGCAIKGIIQQ